MTIILCTELEALECAQALASAQRPFTFQRSTSGNFIITTAD